MATSKIAITIDQNTLNRLDLLVKSRIFPNRSRAIQEAVTEKLERLEKSRLARECAKLDPNYEQALSEEGFGTEIDEWPERKAAVPCKSVALLRAAVAIPGNSDPHAVEEGHIAE